MTKSRFERAEELFRGATELPADERSAFLARECAADDELRTFVERLLANDASAHALDRPALEQLAPDAGDTPVPERIGRYRIHRVLGEGGMGVVYEAEQEEPRRRVAIKVLRSAFSSAEVLARFRREAQVLGSLRHPGIAQVLEAGTAELVVGGRTVADVPFLALEFVPGEPITRAAERLALDTDARLALFVRVCDAVQHAHEQGVVHRDLKPANILVVETASSASLGPRPARIAPKVLDFGVARLVDADEHASLSTRTGQVLGTLAYMSPEQASGRADVDARADVWALGVVLYELLTGRRPFAFDGVPLATAARRLEEDEPPRLGSVDTRLRGDLDTIVAKALEKDPARRYATAAELAADVQRHLAHEPIRARPQSALYVFSRYTRRHRALVIGLAIALAGLIGGLTYGLVRARAERDEAEAARVFLEDVLATPDPSNGGRSVTLLDALERFAPEIAQRFADKPLLEARIRRTYGYVYVNLDEPRKAASMFERALELFERELGTEHPDALSLGATLALQRGKFDEHVDVAKELNDRLVRLERVTRAPNALVSDTWGMLGDFYSELGNADDALRSYDEHVRLESALFGADSARAATARVAKANVLMTIGKLDEADPVYASALAILEAKRGAEHPETLSVLHAISVLRSYQDRIEESRELDERVRAVAVRTFGPDSQLVELTTANLATLAFAEGKTEEAEKMLTEVAERAERLHGRDSPKTMDALNNLASAYRSPGRKRSDLAEPLYRELLARAERMSAGENWRRPMYAAQLGSTLLELQRPAEAEPFLRTSYAEFARIRGADDPQVKAIASALGACLERTGRAEEGAEWRIKAGKKPAAVR